MLQNQRRTGPKLQRISSLSLSFYLGRCSGFLSSGPLTRDCPDLSSLLSRAPCPGQDGLNCRGTATRSSEVVSVDVARHQPSVRFLCASTRVRAERPLSAARQICLLKVCLNQREGFATDQTEASLKASSAAGVASPDWCDGQGAILQERFGGTLTAR